MNMPPRKKTTLALGSNAGPTELYCCVVTCRHNRTVKEDIQMISCILCDISYHYKCINLTEDNDNVWLCCHCKLLSARV